MSGNVSPSALLEECNRRANKRKRGEIEDDHLDQHPFSIRNADHPFARPQRFYPICLIARARLPLAYLDTAHNGSRLFAAHIPSLEDDTWHRRRESAVLLAEEDQDSRLCVVERVRHGTYALCRLHPSVGKDTLLKVADQEVGGDDHYVEKEDKMQIGAAWYAEAATNTPHVGKTLSTQNGLPRLKMRRVMTEPQKVTAPSPKSDAVAEPSVPLNGAGVLDPTHVQASSEAILRDLAELYMEALYIERTSLAYFTKGPLSRARAAFSDVASHELVTFLRQSILPSATMDKKHRESVVDMVKEIPPETPEGNEDRAKGKKKAKKWKAKRSKDGFFVREKEYVERWWRQQDASSSLEPVDAVLRSSLPKLRIRETFLQLILSLEVLALEASAGLRVEPTKNRPLDVDSQNVDIEVTEFPPIPPETKPKARKKQDLSLLLDTMLDKLCIWHSLESQSPARTRMGETLDADDATNDVLKSFCIEVVIPFYMPRIPKFATVVNKKLGGPSAPTPIKRTSSASRKPGEPASRHALGKASRQPLARVSTDTLNRPAKVPPLLHRSATDSRAVPQVKREGTETPPLLDLIPLSSGTQPTRRARPSSLQHLSSSTVGRRVMDLSAMAQAGEAKLRKKTERADMIKEAVEGIKKPNRTLAVQEGQSRTDESFAKAVAKGSKVLQHKARKPDANVNRLAKIAATPAAGTKSTGAVQHSDSAGLIDRASDHPPSSDSIIPCSSARLRATKQAAQSHLGVTMEQTDIDVTVGIPQTGHRPRRFLAHPNIHESLPVQTKQAEIQHTPSRGFARFMPRGLASQPGVLPGIAESPFARRVTSAAAVLSTPVRTFALSDKHEETPSRKLDVKPLGLNATPLHANRASAAAGEEQPSIYAALGWDD